MTGLDRGLVSIIIPVFNGEKSLTRCLDSVLAQSYENIEVIIVDDGSIDGSAGICEHYSANDNRVHLIKKSNSGVSETRNEGLLHACGDFVVFVDCDDYVEKELIDHLVSLMSDEIDFGITGWIKEKENGDFIEKCVNINSDFSADECLRKLVAVSAVQGYPFARIFRTSLIKSTGLLFDRDITMFEDLLFCCSYVKHCRKTRINTSLSDYHYVMYENSSRNAAVHSKTFNKMWLSEISSLEMLLIVVKDSKTVYKSVRARIALSSSFYINRMFECSYEDKELMRELQSNIRKHIGPVLFSKEGDFKWKMQAFLCSFAPGFEYKLKRK